MAGDRPSNPTILVTGPESSGTSLVSRVFRQAGASVVHRSATYAGDYPAMRPLANYECEAVVVVFRDPIATLASQSWCASPWDKLQRGYHEIFRALADISTPIYVITYEQLLMNPMSIDPILHTLGLDPTRVTEKVENRNTKHWYPVST